MSTYCHADGADDEYGLSAKAIDGPGCVECKEDWESLQSALFQSQNADEALSGYSQLSGSFERKLQQAPIPDYKFILEKAPNN